MKIYSRIGSRVMIGLLLVLVVVTATIQHFLAIAPTSMWEFVYMNVEFFISIMVLFAIIIAAGAIAGEFSKGTIKMLLIRPVGRTKILMSKYISSLLFALSMLVVTFGFALLVGGLFFGFESPMQANISAMDGSIIESVVLHLLTSVAFVYVDMIMMITIAFMIATVFTSSALAIGLTIFVRFAGPNVVLAVQQYDWAKYILFAHLNLRQYIGGASYIEGTTMTFSIITIIIYFCIFISIAWCIFYKRDITA